MTSRPTGVCVTLIVISTASLGTSVLKPTQPPLSMSTSARTGVSAVSAVGSAFPFCCPLFAFAWASATEPKAIAIATNHASLCVVPKGPRPPSPGQHLVEKVGGESGFVGLMGQPLGSQIDNLFSSRHGFSIVFMRYGPEDGPLTPCKLRASGDNTSNWRARTEDSTGEWRQPGTKRLSGN